MDKAKIKSVIKKYFILEAAIFAAVIIFDLVSKAIAKSALEGDNVVQILGKVLRLQFTTNYGAGYSMFSKMKNKNILFFITTVIGLSFFGILFYFARKKKPLLRIGIVLMAAGALGNAIDRSVMPDVNGAHTFFSGGVRDFIAIDLGVPFLQFICNVADIALTAGVIMFAVIYLFFDKETPKAEISAAETPTTTENPATETQKDEQNDEREDI